MSKKIYEVWFVTEVGRLFVEAESEGEALDIAAESPSFEEVEDMDIYPGWAGTADDEVLNLLKPEIHKGNK